MTSKLKKKKKKRKKNPIYPFIDSSIHLSIHRRRARALRALTGGPWLSGQNLVGHKILGRKKGRERERGKERKRERESQPDRDRNQRSKREGRIDSMRQSRLYIFLKEIEPQNFECECAVVWIAFAFASFEQQKIAFAS